MTIRHYPHSRTIVLSGIPDTRNVILITRQDTRHWLITSHIPEEYPTHKHTAIECSDQEFCDYITEAYQGYTVVSNTTSLVFPTYTDTKRIVKIPQERKREQLLLYVAQTTHAMHACVPVTEITHTAKDLSFDDTDIFELITALGSFTKTDLSPSDLGELLELHSQDLLTVGRILDTFTTCR